MSNHQASEQALGYLYQFRYALLLLLKSDNPDFQISLEKFDDVAFSENDVPKQLIQVKHHTRNKGSLTDSSTDLWRTLNAWLDAIANSPGILNETEFIIITTAIAPLNSIASTFKNNRNRDIDSIYDKLKNICAASENKNNNKYYEKFLKTEELVIKQLIKNICVIDGTKDIVDVEKEIRKQIRYSCIPKYENQIYESLEGWWFKKIIEALYSDTPIFFTQNQVRTHIVSISEQYANDNLPIDIFDIHSLQQNNLLADDKIFYEQLKLIGLGNSHLQIALRDYYRAFEQRSSWLRNDLLYIDELDEYEMRLIDEWEHAYAMMKDKLDCKIAITENDKMNEGRNLFNEVENKDIRIRQKCSDAFVMRGSYHMLANELKVGWHIDFLERLKNLLN